MEFVIVLPIYFILLGFAFVVGELALHSIHLVSSADRGMALMHNLEEIEGAGLKPMPANMFVQRLLEVVSFSRERKEVDYSYAADPAGGAGVKVSNFDAGLQHVDVAPSSKYDGSWTKAVAGGIIDNYTLTPLTRGFIAHWYYQIDHQVYDGDVMSDTIDRPPEDEIDKILKKGTIGRARMHGNYLYDIKHHEQIRDFGYYCLQRTLASYWNGEDDAVPYRAWAASKLAESAGDESPRLWERLKAETDDGEPFATVKPSGEFIKTGDHVSLVPCLRGSSSGRSAENYDFPELL